MNKRIRKEREEATCLNSGKDYGGLKVYEYKNGAFKEQKANGLTTGGNTYIFPQICP